MPGLHEKALFTAELPTIEDLSLLAEIFYLPYEHGPKAVQMLKEFNWLRANSSVVSVNCKRKETEKVGYHTERSLLSTELTCGSLGSRKQNGGCVLPILPIRWCNYHRKQLALTQS